ncbi:MAG TPA: TylF/MycF/NovP-related O-methyltransferase [Verrucomicrobiae bacterium]|jgi:predicted O-methyltransferase YrrM|nr:TylF/MycF/NovP-related O-methyltransferase [Verrucomicrobiae bacterium]
MLTLRLKFWLIGVISGVALACNRLLDVGRLHPARERATRALHSTVDYIEQHMADALGFDKPKKLLNYALSESTVPGHYLEFGVYIGESMRYIASQKHDKPIHGFDSFRGLPGAWTGYNLQRATFSLRSKPPRVPPNVILHIGWFSDTLPAWREKNSGPVAFVHVDCDIYSSTVDLLEGLADRLQSGTIIVFDEYFNYPNWQRHEFKAWQEFVSKYRVRYEYLAYATQQVAMRVQDVGIATREPASHRDT